MINEKVERLKMQQERLLEGVFSQLSTFFSKRRKKALQVPQEEALQAAMMLVLEANQIPFKPYQQALKAFAENHVEAQARMMHVRTRQVRLPYMWYKQELSALLAFEKDTLNPLAIIPQKGKSFEVYDVVNGTLKSVDEKLAQSISEIAYVFMPSSASFQSGKEQLRYFVSRGRQEFYLAILAACFLGLLGVVPPLSWYVVADTIVPFTDKTQLVFLSIYCLAALFAFWGISVVLYVSIARGLTRFLNHTENILLDRVLSFPLYLLRRYGNLHAISLILSLDRLSRDSVVNLILATLYSVFSLFSLAVLFYLNIFLALCFCAFFGLLLGVLLFIYSLKNRALKKYPDLSASLFGKLSSAVQGMTQLKMQAAQERWFASLMQDMVLFLQQKVLSLRIDTMLILLVAVVDFALLLALFIGLDSPYVGSFSPGAFFAFFIALQQLSYGLLNAFRLLANVKEFLPNHAGIIQLLNEPIEATPDKINPGFLKGELELSQISFRYNESSRQILFDVSMKASPGQFIAIVGPSGAGKSSLIRLLLGFERPGSGAVYYDNQDLAILNPVLIRRQLGVVLQDGGLFAGSILDNIVGASNLGLKEAEEALQMVGMMEDIRRMPMGLQTILLEAGGGLSGGQQQRLLIARALVRKPPILIFDEATSSLDSISQGVVEESIRSLGVTRVVIAHRLSTIRHADYIYVLDKGHVIQEGDYKNLAQSDGLFAQMLKDQRGKMD